MSSLRKHVITLVDLYCRPDQTRRPTVLLTDRDVEHLYRSGLASITVSGIETGQVSVSEKSAQLLQSADMTARVLHAQKCDSVTEILDVANRHEIPIVLLKGISVAEDLYAEPHHRVMGDIDVLAPVEQATNLQNLLCKHNYHLASYPEGVALRDGHHHLPEIRNADGGVALEIHLSLFSASIVADEPLFQTKTIWSNTDFGTFRGKPCLSFRPEFRFVYTVAHWAIDQKWTTNVLSIVDVVLILRSKDVSMDWHLVKSWLTDSPLLSGYLAVILLFLENADVATVPTEIRKPIENSARQIGVINMKVLHWLIVRFPLSARSQNRSEIAHIAVRIFWQAMLEPRHKSVRLVYAIGRIAFRRTGDKSMLGSITNRIRTFFRLAR